MVSARLLDWHRYMNSSHEFQADSRPCSVGVRLPQLT
jgi:hypothetical protein